MIFKNLKRWWGCSMKCCPVLHDCKWRTWCCKRETRSNKPGPCPNSGQILLVLHFSSCSHPQCPSLPNHQYPWALQSHSPASLLLYKYTHCATSERSRLAGSAICQEGAGNIHFQPDAPPGQQGHVSGEPARGPSARTLGSFNQTHAQKNLLE